MTAKRKNAPLEASNVAVLLEHIPIGATRSIHSLQVKRVEADHYSIAGGPVVDLVDAMAQIGGYSGKHSTIGQWYAQKPNPSLAQIGRTVAKHAKAAGRKVAAGAKALAKSATPKKTAPAKTSAVITVTDRHGDPLKVKQINNQWHYFYDGGWIPLMWLGGAPAGKVWTVVGKHLDTMDKDLAFERYQQFKATKAKNPAAKGKRAPLKGLSAAERAEELAYRAIAKADRQAKMEERVAVKKARVAAQKARVAAQKARATKNPAAKFERGKPAGGGHREERGYFYEVLNAAGSPVALTTSKAEAQEVCDNPAMLKLPKGEYTVRHVGGKGSVPMTESKIRGRKVK